MPTFRFPPAQLRITRCSLAAVRRSSFGAAVNLVPGMVSISPSDAANLKYATMLPAPAYRRLIAQVNPTASGRTNVQVQCWCDRRMAVPSVFGRLRNCRSPELPLASLRLKPESKLLPQCRNQRRYRGIRFFRRLRVRYDKRADIHEALLSLGCALICWQSLRKTSMTG